MDKPAIGLIAGYGNADWIAAGIVNARYNGYRTLVTGPTGGEWRIYADSLDAIVVDSESELQDVQRLEEHLATVARNRGFPGLVVHDGRGGRIDLDRSTRALTMAESYAVEAVTEPAVDGARVLAGIPAYNEASTIGSVVEATSAYVDDVLVVDDGSTDETAAEAREAGATVICHRRNRGYGAALKTVFEHADRAGVDHLVVLDADSQHDPVDIPTLIDRQRSTGAELVVGSRFADGGTTDAPLYRRFGLFIVNSLTNIGCSGFRPESWVQDTQSGFRAYSREAIASLADDDAINDRMSASTDILSHAVSRGYTVEEVGTEVSYDVDEANTRHPVRHGLTLVGNLLTIIERRRPLSLFGIPGFTIWIFGLWVGYRTLSAYSSTGTLPIGSGLLSGVLTLGGVLVCVTAVVLHSLSVYAE